ncbi:uncharacterized membrane protein DDB_G0293934-like isoform X2 [Panonychus citri]|uniref:uncharacterized membrane protein DDB_G0293934-like isoform X2 n=1 Tax=Panonychus citri TaxID=50023 RepID=UPI002307A819|nr:uncharacterized membrane protein DDB_G0293934-like isoform X2 [Panonychus citri]
MKMVSCAGCDQPITDRYLDKILDRSWHTYCVKCFDCDVQLTGKCFSRDDKLYCKQDFFKRFGKKCAGCSEGISPEDYVRWALSEVYHVRCFTCVDCHKELSTGDELYILDDYRLLCKRDYLATSPQNRDHLNNNNNNNNLNLTNLNDHRGPSSLSSASPVSSLSSPSSSSLSINYHHQHQQQQHPHLHPLVPHHLSHNDNHHHHQHHHPHQQPLHLLQQNLLNSTNPISTISNHLHHLNHHLLGGNNIKSESLFNTTINHKLSAEPVVQVRQTTRGRPRRKLKKEPLECNNNNNNTNSNNVNSDNLSHSIENQHQPPPTSHLLHPHPSTSSTNSSSTSSSHNDNNVFHDHHDIHGCPIDSLPGNLHESRLGLNKSPSSCPLTGLNGQSTNGNHGGGSGISNGGGSSNGSSSSKSKRVRTSFKHAQLKTMKSYFSINQNPDAKDLKGLAAKTGLSKRVLQVWFQNARAKWRKTSANTKKDSSSETAIVDTSSQHHHHHESSESFSIDYYCKEPFESTGDCDDTLIHNLHSCES